MFITATETKLEHSLRFKSLQSSHGSKRTERAARRVLTSVFPSGSNMADWEQREREGTPTLIAPHAFGLLTHQHTENLLKWQIM